MPVTRSIRGWRYDRRRLAERWTGVQQGRGTRSREGRGL